MLPLLGMNRGKEGPKEAPRIKGVCTGQKKETGEISSRFLKHVPFTAKLVERPETTGIHMVIGSAKAFQERLF